MVTLRFSNRDVIVQLKDVSVIIKNDKTCSILPEGKPEQKEWKGVTVTTHPKAVYVAVPDSELLYVPENMTVKDAKKLSCSVLVLSAPQEKLAKALNPRMVVLLQSTTETSRAMQKATGIQTISVDNNSALNLAAYNALSSQQRLGQF
ncbi:MAG: hypothetical protein AABY01_02875 [Nanoarchaeota archaeon]